MIRFGNAFISVIVVGSPGSPPQLPHPPKFQVQLCVHLSAVGFQSGWFSGSVALWCHNLAEISIDLAAADRNALPLIDTQCICRGCSDCPDQFGLLLNYPGVFFDGL